MSMLYLTVTVVLVTALFSQWTLTSKAAIGTCYTITPIYRTLYRMSSTTESYLCSRTKERTRTRGKKTRDERTWTDPGRTEEGSQHEGTRTDSRKGTRTRIQRMCYRSVYQRQSYSAGVYYTRSSICCNGYSTANRSCSLNCCPVCSSGCYNGGFCSAPNTCSCTTGWAGPTCTTDINECATDGTHNCDQMCHNTPGSYECRCDRNFVLGDDGQTCLALQHPVVLISSAPNLFPAVSPDGNRMMAAATLETDTVAIIGGTAVALVTVVVIVITVLIAIAVVIKHRRADSEVNLNQGAPLPYEEPVNTLDNHSPTKELEREADNSLESEHEYEIPGICDLTSDKVKVPPPKSQLQSLSIAGDYEFTQCPAYVATATISIHSNTNK